jgi:arsenite-transporting ATPase
LNIVDGLRLDEWDKPHFIIATGKGGVGKTTVCIRVAYELSQHGEVLLASLDPAGHLLEYLGLRRPLEEVRVAPRLRAVQFTVDALARKVSEEYAVLLRRLIPGLTALGADNVVKAIRDSPGFEEEVFLRILSTLYQRSNVDYVVIDTPPTGIAVRVVLLPRVYLFWLDRLIELRERIVSIRYAIARVVGREEKPSDPVLEKLEGMRERYSNLNSMIGDPKRTSFIIVATPEPLPVYEARSVVERFSREGLLVEAIVANRVLGEKAAELGVKEVEERSLSELRKIACSVKPPASLVLIKHVEKPPSKLEHVKMLGQYITVEKPSCQG